MLTVAGISLFSALLAGALSFLSPCVSACPPYLCYMAGVSVEDFRNGGQGAVNGRSRNAVILSSVFFTLGFATVFVALGAGASAVGCCCASISTCLPRSAAVIIIIMGLNFLGSSGSASWRARHASSPRPSRRRCRAPM